MQKSCSGNTNPTTSEIQNLNITRDYTSSAWQTLKNKYQRGQHQQRVVSLIHITIQLPVAKMDAACMEWRNDGGSGNEEYACLHMRMLSKFA